MNQSRNLPAERDAHHNSRIRPPPATGVLGVAPSREGVRKHSQEIMAAPVSCAGLSSAGQLCKPVRNNRFHVGASVVQRVSHDALSYKLRTTAALRNCREEKITPDKTGPT